MSPWHVKSSIYLILLSSFSQLISGLHISKKWGLNLPIVYLPISVVSCEEAAPNKNHNTLLYTEYNQFGIFVPKSECRDCSLVCNEYSINKIYKYFNP